MIREDDSETLLHWACKRGLKDIVKRILDTDPPHINTALRRSETPLWSAILSGKTDIVRMLLEKGADVSSPVRDESPLLVSVRFNQVEITTLLLEKMNKKQYQKNINIAFSRACWRNAAANAILLLKAGADPNYQSKRHQNVRQSKIGPLILGEGRASPQSPVHVFYLYSCASSPQNSY